MYFKPRYFKVNAIKFVRDHTKASLRDAKEFVEALEEFYFTPENERLSDAAETEWRNRMLVPSAPPVSSEIDRIMALDLSQMRTIPDSSLVRKAQELQREAEAMLFQALMLRTVADDQRNGY